MVVEFSVKNFRSIKDLQTISFATTGLKSSKKNSDIDRDNIIEFHGEKCFNVIGLYGANASGKSNILKALDYFIDIISKQNSSKSELFNLCQPFLFQNGPEKTESFFQLVFVLNDTKYRYGVTIKKNEEKRSEGVDYSTEIVTNEWLYSDREKNMTPLFIREGNRITVNKLQNKSEIPTSNIYRHNLFLVHSAAYDFTGESKKITDYFRAYATSEFEFNNNKFRWMSIKALEGENRADFFKLLSTFNINLSNIELDEHVENDKAVFPQEKINFIKEFMDENSSKKVKLNLKIHESSGTQKLFDLAGLLLRVFENTNQCFITIDEIDSHFHPALLINIVKAFNNPKINKSKSQLLFTSHDTNLLSPSLMRRDQFYFAEKAQNNSTKIYSLADLKGIRNDANFAKEYLAGHYGALPLLDTFCELPKELSNE
ncbi:AAA family ATPase [Elizabethkingia anophelis]|uniref:AAA family ATPase n=1 Tax=Elizabethkingia anophelis TaxID=1117645 RepID=UPI00293CAD31|nr:abortive infection protein [Elizabethkingia anophelis]